MFCQYCGKPMDDAAVFCVSCGKQKVGPAPSAAAVAAPVAPARSPLEKLTSHVRIMGTLWLIYSIFRIMMGGWTLIFAHTLLPMMSHFVNEEAQPFVISIFSMMHAIYALSFVYALVTGIVGLVAGWGLLQRATWGRVMAIIAAVASAISIPFGTALAVYTFIILFASDAERNYGTLAAPH